MFLRIRWMTIVISNRHDHWSIREFLFNLLRNKFKGLDYT